MTNTELVNKLGTLRLQIVEASHTATNENRRAELQKTASKILEIENSIKPSADWSLFNNNPFQ